MTQWLSAPEERMWRAYLRMRRALDTAIDRQLAEVGLSTADYEVLAPLSEADNHTVRVRDLAARMGWDRSRIAHQLRRMQQRGLVTRHECATDARGTMVTLTDEGMRAIVAAAPGHVATVRAAFVDLLAPDEAGTLTAIAERVVDAAAGAAGASRAAPRRPRRAPVAGPHPG
jgi:DNA-binding MarR family transcriptional regulator